MKIHLRCHTGERPHICQYGGCKSSFKTYGHLSNHIKAHYDIKPFVCQVCNLNFARKTTLKTHMLTHTGNKPFTCIFHGCERRFSEKGNMKTHLKVHYKNKSSQNNSISDMESKVKSDAISFNCEVSSKYTLTRENDFSI